MADGTARNELRGGRPAKKPAEGSSGKAPTGLQSTDADKLRAIREGLNVNLEALVTIANRIHNPELRDAALGNIVKQHARTVQGSLARMNQLEHEIDSLFHIADMMSDQTKRIRMFTYIKGIGQKSE